MGGTIENTTRLDFHREHATFRQRNVVRFTAIMLQLEFKGRRPDKYLQMWFQDSNM